MDYAARPRNFQLNVIPQIGEEVLMREATGEEIPVKVVEERDSFYVVSKLRCMEGGEVVEVDKSSLIKLSGTIPINVVTFQDGSEVFQGQFVCIIRASLAKFLYCRYETAVFECRCDGTDSEYFKSS